MIAKRVIEDIEIGDSVILPSDTQREFRPVVSTESSQVFGEKKCGYYITVRGLLKSYFGYEGEEIPYMTPGE